MHGERTKTSLFSRLRTLPLLYLLDIALLVTVGVMFISDEVVIFFHLVFALLAIGAFFWSFPAFLRRTVFWISIASLTVLAAVYYGQTQPEELLELPLMTIVVISVYGIAQRRAVAQQQLLAANMQLEERARALGAANHALRQESDTRARLQEDVIRSKERYVHMLVHDLKNPLTGSLGFLDMLNMTPVTPEQQDMVNGARTAVRRTVDLVESLLDIARLQENRLHLRRTPTNIATLLTTTLQELQPWAAQESKQIHLVLGSIAAIDSY